MLSFRALFQKVMLTGQVGTVVAGISVEFLTTGLASGTNVGNVTVQANADAIVTGVEATGDAGNVKVFDQVIRFKIQVFSHLFRVFSPAIRYLVQLIKLLKEHLVDLYLEIVYKPRHGKT